MRDNLTGQGHSISTRPIGELVEDIIVFMSLTHAKHSPTAFKRQLLSAKSFSGAIPMAEEFHGLYDKGYEFFADCKPSDLDRPIRQTVFAHASEDGPDARVVHRAVTVTPAEVRGQVRQVLPYMVDLGSMFFDQSDECLIARSLFGSIDGLSWKNISNLAVPNASLDQRWSGAIQMMVANQFSQRYHWFADVGWDGYPTVRLPIDFTGAKDLFRLRDIPEGKQRRAALRKWITSSWREHRDDPEVESYVREHLRGSTRFRWNGLNVQVLPSQYDLDRSKQLVHDRKIMHERGEDLRLAS